MSEELIPAFYIDQSVVVDGKVFLGVRFEGCAIHWNATDRFTAANCHFIDCQFYICGEPVDFITFNAECTAWRNPR